MNYNPDAPQPLITTGRGLFQSGTCLKLFLSPGATAPGSPALELDISLGDENLIEALAGRLETAEWEEGGRLMAKVYRKLVGKNPEHRQLLKQEWIPRVTRALIKELDRLEDLDRLGEE